MIILEAFDSCWAIAVEWSEYGSDRAAASLSRAYDTFSLHLGAAKPVNTTATLS
ncbi:MAG: hypothetical protein HC910_04170 [Spirulinaceae cyanobacterium SM2_1_0]|nr:hypothetical protein [Spirulinaceae cyanobacterium SM2_1_0]